MPVLVISQFDEVLIKSKVPMPTTYMGYLSIEGQVFPSKMYNRVELVQQFIFDQVPIKINLLHQEQFPLLSSRASKSKVIILIWPKFDLSKTVCLSQLYLLVS